MAREGRRRQQYVRPKQPREFLATQQPRLVAAPPSGANWIHEIKFDGYRIQPHVLGGDVTIYTRRGFDWTAKFPKLAADLAQLPDCILDAELCALGPSGQPDFSRLQAAIASRRTDDLVVFVFDILWGQDEDMRPYSLDGRRAVLEKVLAARQSDRIREVDQFDQDGPSLFASARKLGLEGLVAKRRDAPYTAGKAYTWSKIKARPSQEVILVGWKEAPHGPFKGVLTAVYDGGKLTYAGSIDKGFAGHTGLLKRLRELEVPASPFALGEGPKKSPEIHWVRPELVAAADIAEWTAGGRLRQSSFKGLREDKRPEEVVRERPG